MAISVSELWILVLKSRLVDRGVLDGLRSEFAKLPGAKKMTAETVAHWLVTKGALSKWQAEGQLETMRRPGRVVLGLPTQPFAQIDHSAAKEDRRNVSG